MKSVKMSTGLTGIFFAVIFIACSFVLADSTTEAVIVRRTAGTTSTSTTSSERSEYPSAEQVFKGYTKVVSTAGGQKSMYDIYVRSKDSQMLAVLPPTFERNRYFIAMTVASGQTYAGLQAGDMYVYWRRYNNRLALMSPNIHIRSNGDNESRSSVQRLFTDRVLLDVPIVTMVGSSPVIDMDSLLVGNSRKFFGSKVAVSNPRLVKIKKAKAFPGNVELAFEVPASGGTLQTMHYSISELSDNPRYRPRTADERVGYFTTAYSDFGDYRNKDITKRFINRWDLQKADPSLHMSPPKNPIVFYLEHTTPVRYRRWVRQGVIYWNKAFERVGISNAIEVYYQDRNSGAHMEKDPEDVRYNFVRWLSNNNGTAIGPSRVHPKTGQILDADIILTDGWIRHFQKQYQEIMPRLAMEGMNPESLAWLAENPDWDPRIRLALPSERNRIANEIAGKNASAYAGHPMLHADSSLIGDDEFDGLADRSSQVNGMCRLAEGMGMDVAMFRMLMDMSPDFGECQSCKTENHKEKKEDKKEKACDKEKKKEKEVKEKNQNPEEVKKETPEEAKKEKVEEAKKPSKPAVNPGPMIDGIPESFIGPLISMLVCHEVGHTLGLRHNFKGSAIYTMEEINSPQVKDKKTFSSSVMDYLPVNMNHNDGKVQGNYCMIDIGEYDMWAIEYGYTQDERTLKSILGRVADPKLQFATDEDTFGPDPLARRYDMSKEPLDYANNQVRIAKHNRNKLIDQYVKDGQSWSRVRDGYELTLAMQLKSISMMCNWLGGTHVYRDKKGDKNGRLPIEVVPAEKQRKALAFVMENTFRDEAFGLNADLLRRMSVDKWFDKPTSILNESTWPVHDRILGIQASALTVVMNPMALRRIYDNEFLVPSKEDAFTLVELMDSLTGEIWSELNNLKEKEYTARNPMISSIRRNLQREYLDRLISLCKLKSSGAAYRPISNLAIEQMRAVKMKVAPAIDLKGLDPYTKAHLRDAVSQIGKTIEGVYVIKNL